MAKPVGAPATKKTSASENAEDAFAHILQILRAVQSGMQSLEGRNGLSGAQLWALWQLSASPGLRVTELAQALYVRHSTASNLLDKLEQRKLIRRERNEFDRRVVSVALTALGTKVVRDMPGPLHGKLRNALQDISPAALNGLKKGLTEVLAKLT